MNWDPASLLSPEQRYFNLSATEVEKADDPKECGLRIALRSRPGSAANGQNWRRRKSPFFLDHFVQAVLRVHSLERSGTERWKAVEIACGSISNPLHPGLKKYYIHAIESYFDYHESRESQLGPLRLLTVRPEIELPSRRAKLSTWGFLYESLAGDREMRRIRLNEPISTETAWAQISAHIVAEYLPPISHDARVWITEIGLNSGKEIHLFDGISRTDCENMYLEHIRPKANGIVSSPIARGGKSCGGCEIAGDCRKISSADGMLQLVESGPWTKTVSASDLTIYEECPSRWFMQRSAFLPKDSETSNSQLRGIAVHAALASAHGRGYPCTKGDLADSSSISAAFNIDAQSPEYELAEPYLRSHLEVCPLLDQDASSMAPEVTLYGYDRSADVVVATKADLRYNRGPIDVVREVKTIQDPTIDDNPDNWFGKFFSLAWGLVALDQGRADSPDQEGCLELEILTPNGAAVFKYSTQDKPLLRMARGRLRRLTEEWISDTSWKARPGQHCRVCPVRKWCDAQLAE